jgi:hypothetical protein
VRHIHRQVDSSDPGFALHDYGVSRAHQNQLTNVYRCAGARFLSDHADCVRIPRFNPCCPAWILYYNFAERIQRECFDANRAALCMERCDINKKRE